MKKFGFGKRLKLTRGSDKRRENKQSKDHRRKRQPSNKQSGDDHRSRLHAALLYAGLPVVPLHGVRRGSCTCGDAACDRPGRHSRTKAATTDLARIEKYWTKWPKAKIGIALGTESGVLALVTEGAAGKKTLRDLEEKTE